MDGRERTPTPRRRRRAHPEHDRFFAPRFATRRHLIRAPPSPLPCPPCQSKHCIERMMQGRRSRRPAGLPLASSSLCGTMERAGEHKPVHQPANKAGFLIRPRRMRGRVPSRTRQGANKGATTRPLPLSPPPARATQGRKGDAGAEGNPCAPVAAVLCGIMAGAWRRGR